MARPKRAPVPSPAVLAAREEQRRQNREANKAQTPTPQELAALQEQRRQNRLANKSPEYLEELAKREAESAKQEKQAAPERALLSVNTAMDKAADKKNGA